MFDVIIPDQQQQQKMIMMKMMMMISRGHSLETERKVKHVENQEKQQPGNKQTND